MVCLIYICIDRPKLTSNFDHVTQTEIDEVNTALVDAVSGGGKRSGGPGGGSDACGGLIDALSKVPGTGDLISQARSLQASSDAQAAENARSGGFGDYNSSRAGPNEFDAPPGSVGGPPGPEIPGTNTDPATIIPKIYPILVFRLELFLFLVG